MVQWVNYAGFPDSPLYEMAQRYMGSSRCSVLTFGVKGGFEAGRNVSILCGCSNEWSILETPSH